MNHDYCVRLDDDVDVPEIRSHINDMLFPEYLFADSWKPAVCHITATVRRHKSIWFVHPFLISAAGVIVPAALPIRHRATKDVFLSSIVECWLKNYHQVTISLNPAQLKAKSRLQQLARKEGLS